MAPRYRITLTDQERQDLEALTRNGKTGAKKFILARALLLCDAGSDGPAWRGPLTKRIFFTLSRFDTNRSPSRRDYVMVCQVEAYPNLMSGRIALNVRIEFVLLFIDTFHQR